MILRNIICSKCSLEIIYLGHLRPFFTTFILIKGFSDVIRKPKLAAINLLRHIDVNLQLFKNYLTAKKD